MGLILIAGASVGQFYVVLVDTGGGGANSKKSQKKSKSISGILGWVLTFF